MDEGGGADDDDVKIDVDEIGNAVVVVVVELGKLVLDSKVPVEEGFAVNDVESLDGSNKGTGLTGCALLSDPVEGVGNVKLNELVGVAVEGVVVAAEPRPKLNAGVGLDGCMLC